MKRTRIFITKAHAVLVAAVLLLVAMLFLGGEMPDWLRLLLIAVALGVLIFFPPPGAKDGPLAQPPIRSRALRISGGLAAAIAVDLALFSVTPVASSLLTLITTLRIIWATLGGRWAALRGHAAVLALSIPVIVVILGAHRLAADSTRERADIIIAACKQYKAHNGRYPERLDDLFPTLLERTPKARFALDSAKISYFETGDKHMLMWSH